MAAVVLDREEYVEQQYFFRVYRERLQQNVPSQEILQTIHEEILATTRLPLAVDFLRAEILHNGRISDGMARLGHYFTAFQTFVIRRAEDDESRFDQVTALRILESEAKYRAENAVPAGLFVYQFECIARNRLGYNDGLLAMSADPLYTPAWSSWILQLRGDLGSRELAEVVFRASQHFVKRRTSRAVPSQVPPRSGESAAAPPAAADASVSLQQTIAGESPVPLSDQVPALSGDQSLVLFGDQEGRIARANIGRDPLYFFSALQRQLNYPAIPRSPKADEGEQLPPILEARLLKMEQRLKLVEMEQRGGIDLTGFYRRPDHPDSAGASEGNENMTPGTK